MAPLYSTLALSLVTAAVGMGGNLKSAGHHHPKHAKKAELKEEPAEPFKHRLRVCNAYPDANALDVFRGHEQMTKAPLEYKMCGDFASPLLAGDKLKFKVGGDNAGTFTVSDLPNNDAVLLLVIHRHDTLSNAVSFQSHVFANLLNSQIAVIDTFKGRARGTTEIRDGSQKEEKLKFNSVVAVNPGEYKVSLEDQHHKNVLTQDLIALNRENYVVIRVGVEAQSGSQYPQELIVYPMSDPKLLHSAATPAATFSSFLAILLFFALHP